MDYEDVLYEKRGDNTVKLVLNRPEKLNAINDSLITNFEAALSQAEKDNDVKMVIVAGAGSAFCVGRDMSGKGTSEVVLPDWRTRPYYTDCLASSRRQQARWEYIFNFPKITIAQVHGYCLDAGLYLSMLCDFTIASENAEFGDPGVRAGHVTTLPLWTYLIGIKKAKELLFTGKMVDGKEAERMGLVNKAVPNDKLDEEVNKLVQAIGTLPAETLALLKRGYHTSLDARGLAGAWRYLGEFYTFTGMQPVADSEYNFLDVRDKKGLKAAFEEMNVPFRKLGMK